MMEFEILIGGPVPLSECEAHEFDRLSELHITDPVKNSLARELVGRVTSAVFRCSSVAGFRYLQI
jgi:hypothetical protein